ncbi:MAG: putative colanic acid biosynthesis acetyltransferase [Geminicoccaceae bacterium]|nr:hypothetical protein [Geminicoccaceae bacterium]MCB9945293.1 putative colanic acid biosynthesis acetyltransferase [Geminicoccaceae bacterium]
MSGSTVSDRPRIDRERRRPTGMPLVLGDGRQRARRIRAHDLSTFERPRIPGNRSRIWQAAWYLVNATIFRGHLLGLLPSRYKAAILRLFGARVGRSVVIKPGLNIKYPWFVEIGDHVWLGEAAWIDNHCAVRIGDHVCISQGARLFTGNHDWNDEAFGFFCRPVTVGRSAWVGAFAVLLPGTSVPPGTVIMAGLRYGPQSGGSGSA